MDCHKRPMETKETTLFAKKCLNPVHNDQFYKNTFTSQNKRLRIGTENTFFHRLYKPLNVFKLDIKRSYNYYLK